jgi:hypothetical protein
MEQKLKRRITYEIRKPAKLGSAFGTKRLAVGKKREKL